jgi:zinc protease
VSFYIVVRTGSRDEVEPGHSGFAHFFEHMMFRGTEKYPAEKYNDVLKGIGADSNAYTADDRTVYHITAPAAELAKIIEIEGDRFKNLRYDEDVFRTEALAVLGEYNKSASNPFLPMQIKLRDLAFTQHTYKHTTIGFLEDIKAMPGYYQYSLDFFGRFYRPENAVALAVGDVKPDRVFELMQQHFGDWKPGYKAPDIKAEPPQKDPQKAHIEWPNPTRPYLMTGYHTPAFSAKTVDFPTLDIISELLFSEAAPLYRELVVEKQWVDFVFGGAEDHRDPYLFTVAARVKSEELVPEVKKTIDAAFERLKSQPVDSAVLERIKSHLRYRFALQLDSPNAVANTLAHYLGLTGSVETVNEVYQRYQQVTPADVQRVAKQTFLPSAETVVTLAARASKSAALPEGNGR